MRLMIDGESSVQSRSDPSLQKAISRAHFWFEELASGKASTIKEIGLREGVTGRYVSRLLPLHSWPQK